MRIRSPVGVAAVVLASTVPGACGHGAVTEPTPPTLEVAPATLPAIPALGTDSSLDVGTWNLEWFGSRTDGPSPEGRQLDNVWTVMDAVEVDLWAVQEVARDAHFHDLVEQLEGFDGVLVSDPSVAGGDGFPGNLKLGLVYRATGVTVDSARVVLREHENDFAGRPPLEVHLTAGDGDTPTPLVVLVIHAKAGVDSDDRSRRLRGADALKAYLDTTYPDARVLVIGDFNDDVDTSIVAGMASPYRNFVDDAAYGFPTAALSDAGASSTVAYPDMIDHHLASDELLASYIAGTAAVVPAGSWLTAYGESTSDHYPVIARYAPPGAAVGSSTGDLAHVELRWTGITATEVDVYRDGTPLVTTANDGRFIDSVALPAGARYQICEPNTAVCTPEATVSEGI